MIHRDERGQVSVMILGFVLILVLAVAVVVDASAAYLQRSGLDSVADGAAFAGTEALDLQAASSGRRRRARLSPADRRPGRFPGLHLRGTGNRVTVTVHAPLDLTLKVPGAQGAASIGARGTAELTPAE